MRSIWWMSWCLLMLCTASTPALAQESEPLAPINAAVGDISWRQTYNRAPQASDSDIERIRTHLLWVATHMQTTRHRTWTPAQRARRHHLLEELRDYAHQGIFPHRTAKDGYGERRPRFIDHRGVHCAVGELIRRRLSEVLARGEIHDPDLSGMSITVGEVRMTPDLSIATAFVLPLGGQGKEEALAALRRNRYEIRHLVVKGGTMKFAPELRFEIDGTFDQMDATRALLGTDHVRQDIDE